MSSNITVLGNLGADPEEAQSGAGPVRLRVASTTGFGDRQRTTWYRANVWGKSREYALMAFRKGDTVFISGELSADEWEGKDGSKRTTLEINCNSVKGPLKRRPRDDGGYSQSGDRSRPAGGGYGSGYTGGGGVKHQPGAGGYGGNVMEDATDDIPFSR